jgi:hypothetical protein
MPRKSREAMFVNFDYSELLKIFNAKSINAKPVLNDKDGRHGNPGY